MAPLDGQVAFVAGASRGIGRHIARHVAAAGAAVAVAARSDTSGVAAEIQAAGGRAHAVRCDVTDEASVEGAVADTVGRYGRLDVAVCVAARLWLAPTLDTPLERWEKVLRTNLTGVFLVTRAVLPHMLTRASGSLIALTTTGVRMAELGSNAYWVSKAAVERYYVGLAAEVRDRGVAVNLLAPTKVVLTEGWAAAGGGLEVPPEMQEPPELVADKAVWLAAQRPPAGVTGTIQYSQGAPGLVH